MTRNLIQNDFNVVIDFVVEDELDWFCKHISDLQVGPVLCSLPLLTYQPLLATESQDGADGWELAIMNDLKYSMGLKLCNACHNLWINEYEQFLFPGCRPSG
ncbi:hypothetical protein ABU162_20235 [Paenibacillus thiaminolyticus]|uniref:hypothetical protein n=1 Tax=Paenibacillus thiaminolyticus TaxID=49283 RepID=UPI0035A59379